MRVRRLSKQVNREELRVRLQERLRWAENYERHDAEHKLWGAAQYDAGLAVAYAFVIVHLDTFG